jgi:hypothetical protein
MACIKRIGSIAEKKANPPGGFYFLIKFGVLEYWSSGQKVDVFFQHSITPLLHDRKTQGLWQAWVHLFIGYSFQEIYWSRIQI